MVVSCGTRWTPGGPSTDLNLGKEGNSAPFHQVWSPIKEYKSDLRLWDGTSRVRVRIQDLSPLEAPGRLPETSAGARSRDKEPGDWTNNKHGVVHGNKQTVAFQTPACTSYSEKDDVKNCDSTSQSLFFRLVAHFVHAQPQPEMVGKRARYKTWSTWQCFKIRSVSRKEGNGESSWFRSLNAACVKYAKQLWNSGTEKRTSLSACFKLSGRGRQRRSAGCQAVSTERPKDAKHIENVSAAWRLCRCWMVLDGLVLNIFVTGFYND